MLALIRFSDTFTPHPPFISPPKTPYEVIQAQGFKVGFYGSQHKLLQKY